MILHWNGTAWSKVKSPNPGSSYRELFGVSAISGSNAWVVGSFDDGTLILHWNGTAWSKVKSPNPGSGGGSLAGVSAVSGSNAWAVGGYCVSGCSTPHGVSDTLVLHWNGTAWSKVKSPNPSSAYYGNALSAVSAVSGSNAWAVGSYWTSTHIEKTLIIRWNGTAWSRS